MFAFFFCIVSLVQFRLAVPSIFLYVYVLRQEQASRGYPLRIFSQAYTRLWEKSYNNENHHSNNNSTSSHWTSAPRSLSSTQIRRLCTRVLIELFFRKHRIDLTNTTSTSLGKNTFPKWSNCIQVGDTLDVRLRCTSVSTKRATTHRASHLIQERWGQAGVPKLASFPILVFLLFFQSQEVGPHRAAKMGTLIIPQTSQPVGTTAVKCDL